ncbi:hypothetical protein OAP10_04330, partial [Candidatus Pelagibacter sp.]|nr:hypothetical protein [Candidatus Pelagibacter sp.]
MKFKKKYITLIISFVLSIVFSTFIWDKIKLPFNDPGINGIYAQNKFNSFNDVLRYLSFVLIPL